MKKTSLILLISFLAVVGVKAQYTLTMEPSADNTMFNEDPEGLSNGSGDFLFSGTTDNNDSRRALLKFSFDALPSDATVDSVEFSLTVSKSIAGSKQVKIHTLTSDWGEGNSDAPGQEGKGTDAATNDATWKYNFFDTSSWSTEGGDFDPTPSDSAFAGNSGTVIFKGQGLTADVTNWLENPEENFGWIVITDESSFPSAKRFFSREFSDNSKRPKLTVYYQSSLTSASSFENIPGLRIKANLDGKWLIQSESVSGEFKMQIYSISGALIREKQLQIENGSNFIEAGNIREGIYIISLIGDKGRFAEKVVVL